LRGLDSIEDDMSIPREEKRKLLTNFYEKNFDREWHLNQVGDGEGYRLLLERYEHVSFFFNCLEPRFQEVITDICLEMGQGMSQYLDREITTIDDYNLYCHYVAGLVGVGLTRIFALSGLEKEDLSNDPELSNSMGLFLQKTNIIRDIHEDLGQGRTFWPAEVWNKYTDQQEQLLAQPVSDQSLFCLNHLVTEALRHSTDCLEYLSKIRNLQIFKFCAIPQVMAIATLNEIYNNPWVFKKNVKIRKGLAARLIMETCSIDDVRSVFKEMAMNIFKKISIGDPNCEETVSQLSLIIHSESSRRLTAPSANHVVKSFSTT